MQCYINILEEINSILKTGWNNTVDFSAQMVLAQKLQWQDASLCRHMTDLTHKASISLYTKLVEVCTGLNSFNNKFNCSAVLIAGLCSKGILSTVLGTAEWDMIIDRFSFTSQFQ